MKKNYFAFLMVGLLMGFGMVQAQNMATNGDLEAWTAGVPDNWNHVENITQESVIVHGGMYSAKHESASGTQDFGHENITGIVAGSAYNFSYYYLDNDPNAKTRVWSKWMDDGGATIGDAIQSDYSVDNPDWIEYSNTLIAPVGATQFYIEVRVYKEAAEGGFVYYDDFNFSGDQTVYPEPSNYPGDFAAAASGLRIDLTWTESTGAQLPSGYLVLGEKIRGAFEVPVDGVPVDTDLDWTDGQVAVNVAYNMGGYTFDGLETNATYSFTIFPYTNAGANIDYKTDGTAPTAEATTANISIISHEGFDADLGMWSQYSVTGDQVWEWANYGNPPGCAKGNGFSGAAVENEDWLISPALDLTGYINLTFSFDHARNYASNEGLYVMVSTDYSGTGDPTLATWTDLTASFTFPDPGSWTFVPAGTADISAYATEATYLAFVYNSTDVEASTWEVDNADVLGVINTGIDHINTTTLQVYPNPASGFISVVSDEDAEAVIVNLMGQTVLTTPVKVGVNQISVNDFNSGIYLVKVTYANGTVAINRLMVK